MLKISPYSSNINFQAKTKNNKTVTHTNSNGDKFEISYKDGKLNRSYKNGELYKTYQYKGNCKDDITCEFFNDDSSIPIKHLWHVDNKDIKSVVNHQDSTEHFFLRNDKNGIENEPKLFAHIMLDTKNKIEKRNIVKFNDIEEVKFSSVDEAQEYFLKEYGIDAEFNDIFQATIFKQAVDSFIPLNYEDKGKRLFEGLVVRNSEELFENDEYESYAVLDCNFLTDIPDEILEKGTYESIEYIVKHPESISFKDEKILLNPNVDYDSNTFAKNAKSKESSYRFFSGNLTHELGHWLHLKNDPLTYYLSEFLEFSDEEKEIIKEVSEYSTADMTEFVAEYIAGRLENKHYSPQTDKIYKDLGGPNLFKD